MLNNLKFILSLIFLSFNFATTVYAIDITLQWTPNNEPTIAGYRAFYREEGQPYDYENPYWESIDPTCTIYDLDIKQELIDTFEICWSDNVKARIIGENQDNHYKTNNLPKIRSQFETYNYYLKKLEN